MRPAERGCAERRRRAEALGCAGSERAAGGPSIPTALGGAVAVAWAPQSARMKSSPASHAAAGTQMHSSAAHTTEKLQSSRVRCSTPWKPSRARSRAKRAAPSQSSSPTGAAHSNAMVSHVSARHKECDCSSSRPSAFWCSQHASASATAVPSSHGADESGASPRRAMSLWMAEAAYMHESMTTGPSEAMSTRAGSLPNALYRMSAAQIAPMAKRLESVQATSSFWWMRHNCSAKEMMAHERGHKPSSRPEAASACSASSTVTTLAVTMLLLAPIYSYVISG